MRYKIVIDLIQPGKLTLTVWTDDFNTGTILMGLLAAHKAITGAIFWDTQYTGSGEEYTPKIVSQF